MEFPHWRRFQCGTAPPACLFVRESFCRRLNWCRDEIRGIVTTPAPEEEEQQKMHRLLRGKEKKCVRRKHSPTRSSSTRVRYRDSVIDYSLYYRPLKRRTKTTSPDENNALQCDLCTYVTKQVRGAWKPYRETLLIPIVCYFEFGLSRSKLRNAGPLASRGPFVSLEVHRQRALDTSE